MAVLEIEKIEKVAVIKMNNGKNTQNLIFAQSMNQMLEQVGQDENVKALVIASGDEKNWSQGIDLEWMTQERKDNNEENITEFFVQLDQVYSKLMLLPVPTIAAINGHAFGAGAFLATACDYRFMNAQKGFFCFPEIDLNMDFLPGIFKMLIHKLPDFKLPDLLYSGKRATGADLEKWFFAEKACAGTDDTYSSALEFAKNFDKNRNLIASYKQQLNGTVTAQLIELNLEYLNSKFQTQ